MIVSHISLGASEMMAPFYLISAARLFRAADANPARNESGGEKWAPEFLYVDLVCLSLARAGAIDPPPFVAFFSGKMFIYKYINI